MNDEIAEQDSEDPDEYSEERKSAMSSSKYSQNVQSDLTESRHKPYDPELQERIAQIKRNT